MSHTAAERATAAELARLDALLDRALMEQDADAAAAVFSEHGVLGESGMDDVVGRGAIRDFLAAANQVRAVVFHRLERDELVFAGDRVVATCRFDEIKQPHGAGQIKERGRAVVFWRREADGQWRIERLVISDLPA